MYYFKVSKWLLFKLAWPAYVFIPEVIAVAGTLKSSTAHRYVRMFQNLYVTRARQNIFFLSYSSIFQPPLYVTAGKVNTNYLKDSLFDKNALENRGKKRDYKQGTINYHLVTASGIYGRQWYKWTTFSMKFFWNSFISF